MPFAVILIPFFAFAAAFVIIGLSQTHSAQHGTSNIRTFWDVLTGKVYLQQLLSLANQATRALVSRYGTTQLKHMTAYLNGMASLWKQEFAAMRAEAKATSAVAGALERAIPREAKKAAAPAMARAKVADRHATHALGLGHANAKALNRYKAHTNARLKVDAHAIDVTIPHDLAGLRTRNKALEDKQAKADEKIKAIEDGAIKTWEWIRSHPYGAATAAFTAAVGVAIGRLGLGWLRCRSNPFARSKNPCGLWSDLGSLLGLATAALLATDLEQLAREMQGAEGEVTKGIADLVGVGQKLGL